MWGRESQGIEPLMVFQNIIAQGGSFLRRVKKDANVVITAGERPEWIGKGTGRCSAR
jgi:hypothetical protein